MAALGPFYRVTVETAEDLFQLLVRETDLAEIVDQLNDDRPRYLEFAGLSLDDQTPVIFCIPLHQIQLVQCKLYKPDSIDNNRTAG